MDDGQHLGRALYPVHHDDPRLWCALDELAQALGPRRQLALHVGLEEVDPERVVGNVARSQVDLPVPRGPKRKKLEPGSWKNLGTTVILASVFTSAP